MKQNKRNTRKNAVPKETTDSATSDSPKTTSNRIAPDFCADAIVNGDVKQIKLCDYKEKYLIFIFYPMDFSSECPTELAGFSQRIEEFKRINCEVLACSTDSLGCHCRWICTEPEQGGLGMINFPLLSDKNHKISEAYGVLDEKEGIAHRALFIIDENQTIRHININNIDIEWSVGQILHLIREIQHNDRNGQACPVCGQSKEEDRKSSAKRNSESDEASECRRRRT